MVPDHHPATVRNKDKIIMGTWNVRTLNHCGKLENEKQEMQRLEINILRVSKLDGRKMGISKASTIESWKSPRGDTKNQTPTSTNALEMLFYTQKHTQALIAEVTTSQLFAR